MYKCTKLDKETQNCMVTKHIKLEVELSVFARKVTFKLTDANRYISKHTYNRTPLDPAHPRFLKLGQRTIDHKTSQPNANCSFLYI